MYTQAYTVLLKETEGIRIFFGELPTIYIHLGIYIYYIDEIDMYQYIL